MRVEVSHKNLLAIFLLIPVLSISACSSDGNKDSTLLQTITINGTVVDDQDVGLGGLNLTFASDIVETTTDLDGNFTVDLSIGQHNLTIRQGAIELFNQSVTVREDGTFADFGSRITVTLPVDPEPLKDNTVADLPPLHVEPPTPASGDDVTVSLSVPGATQLDLFVVGDGCGTLIDQHVSGATLTQTALAGFVGQCMLEVQVTTTNGVFTLTADFNVVPTEIILPAVSVSGSDYKPSGTLSDAGTSSDSPVILDISSPGSLINGGTGTFQIVATDTGSLEDIVRAQVAIDGIPGFFTVPASIQDGKITLDVSVDQGFFDTQTPLNAQTRSVARLRAENLGSLIHLIFQLVDRNGHHSNQVTRSVEVTEVSAGTLQISLSWDTPTDVDLHVVEPSGDEIYYSQRNSISGGELDLDSNPECNIDGINNENVTWSLNDPPAGEYIVRVDYWESCGGQPANFTVTINNCGQITTFRGSFTPADADRGGAGAGREITRFTFRSCSSARVVGRATYEDFPQTSSGLSSTSTMLPIRHAKVQVRRASDDEVLTEDSTDGDGRFDIEFQNEGTPGYYVSILAEQDNEFVKQKVVDDNGDIYARKSEVIDETIEPEKTGLMIEAKRTTAGPAFNIFDIGVMGATVVRSRHGETPPLLTWLWTSGKKGECGNEVSCYQGIDILIFSQIRISVLSIPSDPDEYDDLVLLHEYGHFYQYHYSQSNSPGGNHRASSHVDPRLAWGEGSATFFGNYSKGTSLYLDTNASVAGIGVRLDIESVPNNVPLGTSDGGLVGRVSEAVVAAIMWDLADGTNESPSGNNQPRDTVKNPDGVFAAMGYVRRIGLLSGLFSGRNHIGVDLVDFLDGWFCVGNGSRGDANNGVEGIVNGLHKFPYDFADDVCE